MNIKFDGHKRFVEDNFSIVNKDKIDVPFKFNPAQDAFINYCTLNNIILKARKLGFSSVLLALAAVKFLMGTNERCVSMSFDATASGKQLERAKHFIKSYEYKTGIEIPLKYNSKSELVYEGIDDNGRTFTNTLRIGTAKATSFGRGDDITFLHLTEVSQCDHLDQLLAGVGEALVHGAMTTLETTANGFNQFKQLWDESVLGLRDFTPMFFSPEWEYDAEYLEVRRKKLGNLFNQEYPMTPEEAFIASGATYLDKVAMNRYLEEVKAVEPLTV
jgi:hypothetical protein